MLLSHSFCGKNFLKFCAVPRIRHVEGVSPVECDAVSLGEEFSASCRVVVSYIVAYCLTLRMKAVCSFETSETIALRPTAAS
jgi:hypothetical protein